MRKIPYARHFAFALAAFIIYTLFGFFAMPPILKHQIGKFAAETLQRKTSIGELRVNPLLLSLEIQDFALTEQDGAPIAGFKRLFADFELSSLFRLAWTFSAIELDGLDLRADIAPDGRFNILALLDSLPKTEPRPDARLPRALLHRLALKDGAISFTDRSLAEPASGKLSPIDLEVHEISTLPERRGDYTVNAKFADESTLSWRGDASLQPIASQGEFAFTGAKPGSAWRFLRNRVGLAEPQGSLDFSVRYRLGYAGGKAELAADDIKVSGKGIAVATTGAKNISLALASLEVTGGGALLTATRDKPWQAKLAALKFTAGGLEFTDGSRATPYRATFKEATGALSASADERANGPQALIEGIAVTLSGLSAGAPGAAQSLIALDSITLESGKLDLIERRLDAGRVTVSGGDLRLVRDKDGSLPALKLLAPADEGLLRREIGGLVKDAKAEGRPWRIALQELAANDTRVSLTDHTFGDPVSYDVRDLRFALHGFESDAKAPLKFDATLRLEQGGTVKADGEALLSGEQAELRVKVERLNLKPLQPAIATRARVKLESGEFSANLKGSYRKGAGKLGLRLGGTLRVDNLLVNEAGSGERLLAWKSLSASGLSLGLEPDQLKIEEAKLDGLGAKLVVFADRSVNMMKALILKPGDDTATQPAATLADTKPLFPVTIDRVRFENGVVDFADLSLVLPFGAKVHQMTGLVEGVSTDRASRASVKLEGRVDEFGLARAGGSVEPFHPTDFMDLNVIFRNVDMPALSAYSATFAGRRIATGKLSLDLKYKINKGQLAGDNRVVLEKFTLGEKVESPSALSLPLDLAIALLTDSDGKIDLAVPVTGDINDPKFSYGPIIWQAIRTVLTRIVTAPFRALGHLFGGGGESLEAIVFDPGRAVLLPPEQEKLKHVAEGLAKRQQLRLVAEGQTGPADRAALQQRDVARAVNTRLGRTPAPNADPDPVNVADAKTQRALEAVFIERQSEDALNRFVAETAKARGKEVSRANIALALIGTASADREFYAALQKRLNDSAQVPDAALAQLAGDRARAVTNHMTTALAIPAERAEARVAKSAGEAQVKLELDVTAAK
jgi:Domain of Unknown Function (DUF748)